MVDLPRLNTASQLTLVTIRLWVREHLRCQTPVTGWDEGLVAAGLPPQARRALDELLTMLALMPDMLSAILPVCAHRISGSELALLRMFAECASDDSSASTLIAALPPTIARLAEQRCQVYARAMGEHVSTHQIRPDQRIDEVTVSSAEGPVPQRMH
ncbi:MAG: hypothetical protein JJT93_09060 [Gammaproteobacteria bacterium]|nr:hypothetical protein [Gammaproteobacteria bacterium]